MGLVLTLVSREWKSTNASADDQFKGSVFAILQEENMKREEEAMAQEASRQRAQQAEYEFQDRSQNPNYSMGSDGYY
jgi:hypothetical protein